MIKKPRVLHIGYNSSIPLIFESFAEKVFLFINSSIRPPFQEQKHLEIIDSKIRPSSFLKVFRKAGEIRKAVKKHSINIVFVNRKDDMIAAKIAFLFNRKRPLLFGTFHNPYAWTNNKKVRVFARFMNKCLDGHLCMASFAYNKLLSFNYPKDKIIFFQNYIKFESFEQKKDYSFNSPFKICYSGTIDSRKNELFIAKLINDLKNKYSIIYNIFGPFNEKEYENKFISYIKTNHLQDVVRVFPRLSPLEERKAFLCHDLYISASKAEMCPLNILNAKACGMPILISDSFGQQDLITNGFDGLKYKEDDFEDAKRAIVKVINNEQLRRQLGKNAFLKVSTTDSYLVAAEKLKSFINKIAQKRKIIFSYY